MQCRFYIIHRYFLQYISTDFLYVRRGKPECARNGAFTVFTILVDQVLNARNLVKIRPNKQPNHLVKKYPNALLTFPLL